MLKRHRDRQPAATMASINRRWWLFYALHRLRWAGTGFALGLAVGAVVR